MRCQKQIRNDNFVSIIYATIILNVSPQGNDPCNQQQCNTMDIIIKNLIDNPNINLQTTYRINQNSLN